MCNLCFNFFKFHIAISHIFPLRYFNLIAILIFSPSPSPKLNNARCNWCYWYFRTFSRHLFHMGYGEGNRNAFDRRLSTISISENFESLVCIWPIALDSQIWLNYLFIWKKKIKSISSPFPWFHPTAVVLNIPRQSTRTLLSLSRIRRRWRWRTIRNCTQYAGCFKSNIQRISFQ